MLSPRESTQLLKWQSVLINQIINPFKKYYCLSDKIDAETIKNQLVTDFQRVNVEYKKNEDPSSPFLKVFLADNMPAVDFLAKYKILEKINEEALYKIDLHLQLQFGQDKFGNDFIARDMRHGKGLVFDYENQ